MARRLRHFPEGTLAFVTDRCIDEQYLLLPDAPQVTAIIEGAWREALRLFPVELLLLTAMSNHWHAIVKATTRDQTAIPKFMQYVKSRVAREINELRGRHGTFWSERYHAIPILDEESLIDRIAYALHNPVKAGLCATAGEWPGLSTLEALTGIQAACGPFEFPVSPPDAWKGLDRAPLAAHRRALRDELRARADASADDRKARGLERPKVKRTLAAVTWSMRPEKPARARAPMCFAATAAARKAFRLMWREMVRAYRIASEKFRGGLLDVSFPPGMFAPWVVRPPNEAPS